MPRTLILLTCAILLAVPTIAQEKAPVVLVWGEYLAQASAREAPGTRNYMNNIASALDAVGLAYEESKDSQVANGALEGHKFAIFPYNGNLTDEERDAIRAFVAAGGKIWASFTQDPALNELLGVRIEGSRRPEYAGYYTDILFGENAPEGVPEAITVGSWYSHGIRPAEGTQIIGTWRDGKGKDTQMPALSMNANGYYHGHVMLGGDAGRKGQMFLALIGRFFPEIWQGAVQKAIAKIDEVHGPDSFAFATNRIKQAREQGLDTTRSQDRLGAARALQEQARELFADGRYPAALTAATRARSALGSATFPLALGRTGELRAVWMGKSGDWDAVMRDLSEAGLNAVFPNLCDAGGADYESAVLPRSAGYTTDHLAACIAAARKYKIEVHPWRINWRLGKGTPERVAALREAGRLTTSKDGTEGDWLCPSDPRNLKLEADAMVEMAQKYAVDGIHFDYIRYGGADFCYCDKCHVNFERDAGTQVTNWPADVLRGGPHYDAFQDWRREQITRLVREVYKRAHAIRPDIVVSAAVFSNWPSSRTSIGQDAAAWAEEGIVDLLMPMTYTNSDERLASLTKQHVALTRGRAVLVEGIGAFSSHSQFQHPTKLINQIEIARSLGADGFCIFSYGSNLKQGFLSALGEGCTGPATYTPLLRPEAEFMIDDKTEGGWLYGPGSTLTVQARVTAAGPWAKPLASLSVAMDIQGLDGRSIAEPGPTTELKAGASHTWKLPQLSLKPGGYRLALVGQAHFDDGTTREFICRSRPLHILTDDENMIRQGKLPAPEAATGNAKVAILDGYGAGGILEALQDVWQVEAELVPALTPGVARTHQVLIITQGRGAASIDPALASTLKAWIASGGAVLTTHDAVGYREHAPIAPEIAAGVSHKRESSVRAADSPLVPEYYRGAALQHAFYDHIILSAGSAGIPLVTDAGGRPVVVAGQIGKGRYVASGIAIGLNADTEDEAPTEDEFELLSQLLLWLANGG